MDFDEKTLIRKLKREDIEKMMKWGKHKDPVFDHYNFPMLTKDERDIWYKIKVKKFGKKCFAIENTNRDLIGYISLRDIKYFKRESELGIVFNPDMINNGYGTNGLLNFLDVYFNKLKMQRLLLKVAKFNKRALRCYQKCGFEIIEEVYEEFEEQFMPQYTKDYIAREYEDFDIEDEKLMTTYYYMHITRKKYNVHRQNSELLISM